MTLKRVLLILPVAVGLVFLVAFVIAAGNFDKKQNEFVDILGADPKKLNPILFDDSPSGEVIGLVFNGLVKYDQDLRLVGDLATGWDVRQHSRFYLKADAGLTAQEAAALLERDLPADMRTERKLTSIKVLGPLRVELNWDSGGTAYQQAVLKLIPKDKIEPVKLIWIELNAESTYPGGEKCDVSSTVPRLREAFAKDPKVAEKVLDYTVESTGRLVVTVLGDETPAKTVIDEVLKLPAPNTPPEESKASGKESPAPTAGVISHVEEQVFQDKPVVTFHLRHGVKFQDKARTEFTSKDVRFLYDMVINEKTLTVRRSDFELIEDVLTPDPYTVEVHYKKPYSSAVATWGYGIMPSNIYSNDPEKFNKGEAADKDAYPNLSRHPIGTGPWKFVEWKTGQWVRLEAFDDYFDGRPLMDRFTFRILPEQALAQVAFVSEGADLLGPGPFQAKQFEEDPEYTMYRQPALAYTYIGWNAARDLFKDVKVRRALTQAINREEIVRYVLQGFGRVSNGIYPQQLYYSNPNVEPLPYDPAASARLLAEAGWKDTDGDGILEKDGRPFSFLLIYNSNNDQRKSVAELVQEQLRKLGIRMEILAYEFTVFLDKVDKNRDYDACVLGWSVGLDPDPYQIWHSSQRQKGKGFNFVDYNNPRVDRLIEEARTEFDQDKQRVFLWEIQKIIYDDQPYTFLYVPESTPVMHKGAFRMRRPDPTTGKIVDEPVEMPKAGLTYYLQYWYRVQAAPAGPQGKE